MRRLVLSSLKPAACGLFFALSLPSLAAEIYPATGRPGNGVNWSTTVSLVDSNGVVAALASGDTELSCNGGALTDTTEATSSAAGVATVTFDASTNDCKYGTIVVKGTNHVASVATVHFAVDNSLIYAGTVSDYDDTTPTGCAPTGASVTLNTTDQGASATNGFYNGMWMQPFDGTGEKQNGRWISKEYTYDGTNKIACLNEPFVTALDSTSVVLIYTGSTETPIATDAIAEATRDVALTGAAAGSLGEAIAAIQNATVLIDQGACDSGSTTTCVDAARTEADADYWKGAALLMLTGSNAGQYRCVTGFNATTDTITVESAFTQAITTNTYQLVRDAVCTGVAP